MECEGCDRGRNREASSFGGETESEDDESESSGEGVKMVTSKANDTERHNAPLVLGRTVSSTTSRARSSVHSAVSFDPKGRKPLDEDLADAPATLTAFRMIPISSLLHCAPGKQKYLPNTSADRYARLFLKGVRVLNRDARKTLPEQAWYLWRTC